MNILHMHPQNIQLYLLIQKFIEQPLHVRYSCLCSQYKDYYSLAKGNNQMKQIEYDRSL